MSGACVLGSLNPFTATVIIAFIALQRTWPLEANEAALLKSKVYLYYIYSYMADRKRV